MEHRPIAYYDYLEPPRRSAAGRRPNRGRRVLAAAAVLASAAVAVGGVVEAAKGGGGRNGGNAKGGDSLSLVMLDASDSVVNHGDWITFDVTSSADKPVVTLECHQGGELVLTSSAGFFDAYPWSRNFEMTSMAWADGGASCEAKLQVSNKRGTKWSTAASLQFDVQP